MLTVHQYETIRQAYYIEQKSIRQISREYGHSYWTVRKALDQSEPEPYRLKQAKAAPVLGPYKERIEAMLEENERLPRKQRYTGSKIYQILCKAGYQGAESTVRYYVSQRRKVRRRPAVYLPLSYEPGVDAQVDWGEATVVMQGERVVVQLFIMRLCYSRKLFVMAFPTQRQEAFLLGHVLAFAHFGGAPQRIVYDNLKTAVRQIQKGRSRIEQDDFVRLRSYYLFDSRFCTPAQGHEKGGVESGVGYSQRHFLTPMPVVADFDELNAQLLAACNADDQRVVERSDEAIGVRWQAERPLLRPLPTHPFVCCVSREVTLNGYSQVRFETNRYSVPVEKARKHLTVRAYPFTIDVMAGEEVIATHKRCYAREQDILDPLHYLRLVAERPGAFEHAHPLREWRQRWPPAYETLLATLRRQHASESAAIRTFVQILEFHQQHAADLVEKAVEQALHDRLTTPEGVRFCLDRLLDPTPAVTALDLSTRPALDAIGQQTLSLSCYNQLLSGAGI